MKSFARGFFVSILLLAVTGCGPVTDVDESRSAIVFTTPCVPEPGSPAIWGPTCYYGSANCSVWSWRYFWRSVEGRVIERTYVAGIGWDSSCYDISPYDRSHVADIGDPWNVGDGYVKVRVDVDSGRHTWDTMDGGDTWMQIR